MFDLTLATMHRVVLRVKEPLILSLRLWSSMNFVTAHRPWSGFPMSKRLSISLLLQAITGLMAIALVVSFAVVAGDAYKRMQTAERVLITADVSRDLFMAMQNLMVERGTVNTALAIPPVIDDVTADTVTTLRAQSELALKSALAKLSSANLASTGPAVAAIRENHDRFAELRRQADMAVQKPLDQRPPGLGATWVAEGGKLVDSINLLSDVLSSDVVHSDTFIAEMMKIKQLAWAMRDAAGLDRLLIGAAVAKQNLPPEIRQLILELTGRVDTAWKIITDDARLQEVPTPLQETIATAQRLYFGEVRADHKLIVDALIAGKPTGEAGAVWIGIPNRSLEPLINIANTAFDLTASHAKAEVDAAQRHFLVSIALMLFFIGFGLFATGLVNRRVVRPMATITEAVRSVAAGDLATGIPFKQRRDELGDLARALAVFRDNAFAKQRMEGELIRKERLSALGHLTATVAHELRNPLSAIRNAAYVLRDLIGGSGVLERPVARIERNVARCERIIADLLDFTRIRDLQRTSIAADEWLGGVLDDQKLPDGVTLVRQLAAAGRQVEFDGERMRQVVINLVENAAQALAEPEGEGGDRRIIVATRATDEFFEIAVRDTGPGVPAQILAKVFEPLFTTKTSGTGLGLPTVKQIVEQHGGAVTMTSELGTGTLVTVRLRCVTAKEVAA
jgi:signal transduction histidine kinase